MTLRSALATALACVALAPAAALPAQAPAPAPVSSAPAPRPAQPAAAAIAPDTFALADAILDVAAPAADDPDGLVRALLAAAVAHPGSALAPLLCGEAHAAIDPIADPAGLAAWLDALPPQPGLTGQRLAELRDRLALRLGRARDPATFAAFATDVLVLGPFGDAGGDFLDEPYAPEAGWPRTAAPLVGRFGPVLPRAVHRRSDRPRLELLDPQRPLRGACYVRWAVAVAAPALAFVEVEYRGPFLVRVDGTGIGRAEPHLAPCTSVHRLPVRLAAGAHEIVVKTGDESTSPLSLRLVDARGAALAGARELRPDAVVEATGDPRGGQPFAEALPELDAALAIAPAERRATLRTAAAWVAVRTGEPDRALRHAADLLASPPERPRDRLAFANVLRRLTAWPEESRLARAVELEREAAAAMPPHHHRALLARVLQLSDQDRREDALRLLRTEVEAGRAGPETFAATFALVRRLRFTAEEEPLLELWAARCPGDVRPRIALADLAAARGDARTAADGLGTAAALAPQEDRLRLRAIQALLGVGDEARARDLADGAAASVGSADEVPLVAAALRLQVALGAFDRADEAARGTAAVRLERALREVAEHPSADAATLRRVGERWLQLGDDASARQAFSRSLDRDPDQPAVRELLARLVDAAPPGADFARFHRDGDAVIAAARPGPLDEAAATSLWIDQRIVEVFADGSTLTEVHELRRINDQTGVEVVGSLPAPARTDDLLLVRTVDAAGRSWVPNRVQDSFSMPRLAPGVFVEWRHRTRGEAAGPSPLLVSEFLLGSAAEPLHLTEYVLILPAQRRGEVRTRNFEGARETVDLPGGRTAFVFRRQDVPRLPEESDPPPSSETLPTVQYGEDASSWPELRRSFVQWTFRTRPTPPIEDHVATLREDDPTPAQLADRILAFCQREIDDGPASEATETLLRRKGSRHALAIAMLRAAGIDVDLGSCRIVRNEFDPDQTPMFAPADPDLLPCALVRPAGGEPKWLFADAPRHWPAGQVPAQRSGALAWLLRRDSFEQVRLPAARTAVQHLRLSGTVAFGSDAVRAELRGAIDDLAGYGIAERLREQTADIRKVFVRQIGQQILRSWRVRSGALVDLDPPGRPLAFDLVATDAPPQPAGDGRLLAPLPLPASELRAQLADRDQRTLPLRVYHDLDSEVRVVLRPPDGFAFAPPPPPFAVSFGLLDYQQTFTVAGQDLVVHRRVRVRPGTVPVAVYPDWSRELARIDRAEQYNLALLPR